MKNFIGRKTELQKLRELRLLNRAHIAVIKGRRRIGKSRLAKEFAKDQKFLEFTGLTPSPGLTNQDQRNAFAQQLSRHLQLPTVHFVDWTDAFNYLSHHLTNEPTVILFDEISWMNAKDPTFVPKLKAWWDLDLQNRQNIVLIFCGSISIWIEKNIINSTAFFGRISLTIDLEPLSLPESMKFLQSLGFKGSTYEAYKLLACLGGIPWYLEQILPNQTSDHNIKRLCFEKNGLLTSEFNRIFHDLFNGHGEIYKKVLELLKDGMKALTAIRDNLSYARSGALSNIMQNLIKSGFVTKHYQWSIKSGSTVKQSLYRLSDCYTRFYLKYIEPNADKIEQDYYKDLSLSSLSNWEAILGFQIESLLLQNRPLLLKAISLSTADVVGDNPYYQTKTLRKNGCQIDYLIQMRTKNLFVCEFKFKRRELGNEIIEEMQDKISRFSAPHGYGVIPVLFHLGGVSQTVYDNDYFYRIIDIADFLYTEDV